MEKLMKVVNSWWFNAALAGCVALGFSFKGFWFACGIAIGVGVTNLIIGAKKNLFKKD